MLNKKAVRTIYKVGRQGYLSLAYALNLSARPQNPPDAIRSMPAVPCPPARLPALSPLNHSTRVPSQSKPAVTSALHVIRTTDDNI